MTKLPRLQTILVEITDAVATVTLNRPGVRNALDTQMLQDLLQTMELLERDAAIHAIILTGSGDKAFCAGADVKELVAMEPREADDAISGGRAVMNRIEALDVPVIAAVNGYAIGGGCELALACDLRTASSNARLGFPEASLGSMPSWGGTRRLTAVVGPAKARELLYTGDLIDTEEAMQVGLVNRLFDVPELLSGTAAIAHRIARMSPVAIRTIKHVLTAATASLAGENAILEELAKRVCDASYDQAEGRRAFLERRPPRFQRIP